MDSRGVTNDPTLVALTVMTANGVKSKGFICPIGLKLLNVKSTAMRRPVSRYSGSRGCPVSASNPLKFLETMIGFCASMSISASFRSSFNVKVGHWLVESVPYLSNSLISCPAAFTTVILCAGSDTPQDVT